MSNVRFLRFQDLSIRTTIINGKAWWVAKDVCKALGLSTPSRILACLDQDNVKLVDMPDSLGRNQKTSVVEYDSVFDIIDFSENDNADNFKQWVLSCELPTIDDEYKALSEQECNNQPLDIDELEQRIQGVSNATGFMLSAFSAYVENKEGEGANLIYFPKNSFLGINFISELIQSEYQKIINDIRMLA